MTDQVPGLVIRARGARVREIGGALTERFQASQVGTERPGLTLEDGSLVVTDNYLKVRIPPGHKRNERVRVRLTGTGTGIVNSPSQTPGELIAIARRLPGAVSRVDSVIS